MRQGLVFSIIGLLTVCASAWGVNGVLPAAGTQANPYLIEDVNDFDAFANPANAATYWAAGVHTKLMTDIDLSGRTYQTAVIAPDTSTNSGFQGTQFTGNFDGDDHILSNLTIITSTKDYIGLFGYVGSGCQIINLGVININFQGNDYVGGLVGANSGVIMSCHKIGAVNGRYHIGGIGGLCGQGSTISNSYVTGNVTGEMEIGGLCGTNYGTISSSYTKSSVIGSGNSIGGLCGTNNISGGHISNCYAAGEVTGEQAVGGLCGFNGGIISNSYAMGAVTGDYASGLCGGNRGTLTECFWDVETSGIGNSGDDNYGSIGKTTAEMMTQSTFTGWDFTTPVWMMLRPGEDYPRLAWQGVFDGDIAGLYGVDMVDFARLASWWDEPVCDESNQWCQGADIDHLDGVDIKDLAAVADDWLK